MLTVGSWVGRKEMSARTLSPPSLTSKPFTRRVAKHRRGRANLVAPAKQREKGGEVDDGPRGCEGAAASGLDWNAGNVDWSYVAMSSASFEAGFLNVNPIRRRI